MIYVFLILISINIFLWDIRGIRIQTQMYTLIFMFLFLLLSSDNDSLDLLVI